MKTAGPVQMGELTSRYKRRLKTDADKKARLLCILHGTLIGDI